MLTKTKKHKCYKRSGVAALEFLFAAPAFFILVFFVVEVALIWNDRHIMRLAAYRAARSVVKNRAIQTNSSQLCWAIPQQGAPVDPENEKVQTSARRAAAKVMATVTPSITQLFTMLHFGTTPAGVPAGTPFENLITSDTESAFGSAAATVGNNPYVHAIVRMMKGLPAAWLFTDLRCSDIEYPATSDTDKTKGVEITLVYQRPAKMPFVGNLMYTLKKIQEFAEFTRVMDDGTSGVLKIDPLNYGLNVDVDLSSPQMQAASLRLKEIVLHEATELGKKVQEKIDEKIGELPVTGTSGMGQLPQVFGAAAGVGFDAVATELKSWNPSTINWVADQALQVYLSVPEEIKRIPVTVSVRIPNYSQVYANKGNKWNNNIRGIGSPTDGKNMTKLAKEIGRIIDTEEPMVKGNPTSPTKENALPIVP